MESCMIYVDDCVCELCLVVINDLTLVRTVRYLGRNGRHELGGDSPTLATDPSRPILPQLCTVLYLTTFGCSS